MVRGTSFRGAPSRGAETAVGDTAEVVFLGELTGATGFGSSASGVGVSCKYVVVHGEHWHLARGDASGATQASHASEHGGELAAWGHPVQLSFNTTSVQVRDPAVVDRAARVTNGFSSSRFRTRRRETRPDPRVAPNPLIAPHHPGLAQASVRAL